MGEGSVFAKFTKEAPPKRKRFIIATDESQVRDWKVIKKGNRRKNPSDGNGNDFRSINSEIFNQFIAFLDVIPLLISMSHLYPSMILDNEIYDKFCNTGIKLDEDDDYIIFSADIGIMNSVRRAMRKIESVDSIEKLFPQFYVVGLVSHYDNFIHEIANKVIQLKPHIVFNNDRSIGYSDIISVNDIEDIRSIIVEKELEDLLRKSHEEQLQWFSKNLDMKMEPDKRLMSKFVEICERRNLFAHNGGHVSRSYLKKCERYGYDISEIDIGEKLYVTRKYLQESVETLIEMSFQILYVVWQKIDPASSEDASKSLINITYNLIYEEKYDIAIRLIEFILNNKSTKMDENTKKTHTINCANAMKLSGRSGYIELLGIEDWSAATPVFLLCRSAIMDDVRNCVRFLEDCSRSEIIGPSEIREWPVFRGIREEPEFIKKYEEIFGEKMFDEKANKGDGGLIQRGADEL